MRLEEHGLIEVRQEGLHGGIESFEMADLQDTVNGGGLRDEPIGFRDGAGDGLLDQEMQAGVESHGGRCGVGAGGRADGRSM